MHGALSFARAVTKMETFSSACVIRVPAFPAGWPSNFSSHSFRQKPKGPEWDWQLPAASSKRTAEPSRERIVMMGAPVLRFACRKQGTTNRKWRSSVCGEQAQPHRNSELKLETATCSSAYVKKAWEDSCSRVGCVG